MISSLWVDKYRPQTLCDVVLPTEHQARLAVYAQAGVPVPPLFFHGAPGTGKTSTAYAFIHSHPDFSGSILSVNGSDEHTISVVRDKISTFAISPSLFRSTRATRYSGNLRFVVVDEVDYMDMDAQRALKALVQSSPTYTCYCFICNYIHKVDQSLFGLCSTFSFSQLPREQLTHSLRTILRSENKTVSDQIIDTICATNGSDVRSMLYSLQYTCESQYNTIPRMEWEQFHTRFYETSPDKRFDFIIEYITSRAIPYIDFFMDFVLYKWSRDNNTHLLSNWRALFQAQHKYAPYLFIQTAVALFG